MQFNEITVKIENVLHSLIKFINLILLILPQNSADLKIDQCNENVLARHVLGTGTEKYNVIQKSYAYSIGLSKSGMFYNPNSKNWMGLKT